jgi:hypothetical protein
VGSPRAMGSGAFRSERCLLARGHRLHASIWPVAARCSPRVIRMLCN